MATATKKKTKSIGQVAYLTKQVESLGTELIRKDIEKLDQKVDNLDNKVESNNKIILAILGILVAFFIGGFTVLSNRIDSTRIELKQDMKDLKQDINKRFDKIERAIESINQKLK